MCFNLNLRVPRVTIALLDKSPNEQRYDGSLTSYSHTKKNKNKLAELLSYKSDVNFGNMAADILHKPSISAHKTENLNQISDDVLQLREQVPRSANSRSNVSAIEMSAQNGRSGQKLPKGLLSHLVCSAIKPFFVCIEHRALTPSQSYTTPTVPFEVVTLQEQNTALRATLNDYHHAFNYLLQKHKHLQVSPPS